MMKWNDKKRSYKRSMSKLAMVVILFASLLCVAAVTQIDLGTQAKGTLKEANGGTNQTTYTLGDLLYASAANTMSKLAGNTTATKNLLCQTGTGSVSAAPIWCVLVAADIPSLDAAKTTTGVFSTARLGTGTQDSTHYLRGDGTWATIASALTSLANETPTGTVNSSNVTFTTAHTCTNLYLFKNGQRMTSGASADYTYSTSTITFTAGGTPQTGDVLLDDCEY